MYDKTPTDILDQAEEELLTPTVTDDALETAAGAREVVMSVSYGDPCTYICCGIVTLIAICVTTAVTPEVAVTPHGRAAKADKAKRKGRGPLR